MVEEFLDELADGVAGLFAKVFGDLGLLQASLVDQFGQGFDAGGRRERDKQSHGIRQIAAAFPVRVNADGNLEIHPRWVGNDEAEFKAVGEDAEPFAGCEQHTLRDAGMAETVGKAASGGGIEVGVKVHTPDAQLRSAVLGEEQCPPSSSPSRVWTASTASMRA
ncbi:MAG: hypothetical protein ABSC03_08025 [Verrucomicrobiota bacterium]